jgi:hypothetical protein
MKTRATTLVLVAMTLGTFAACEGPGITEPTGQDLADERDILGVGTKLVECPATDSETATALVSPLGGVVSVAGASISIPAGALLLPSIVTVTVPASKFVEVDVSVAGVPHFTFELPVTVTISYARCTRSDIDRAPLSAWYIESATKALLENMGGVDDKVARTVTFRTGHLSGYAVAN